METPSAGEVWSAATPSSRIPTTAIAADQTPTSANTTRRARRRFRSERRGVR